MILSSALIRPSGNLLRAREVKDREEFIRRCEAMHLEVNRIPKGDTLLTFVKDYDGNLFEIKGSK